MKLLLVRGVPGSGKSTYAKQWAEENNAVHVEAYMYFVQPSGRYAFDPKQIGAAHDWCQLKAAKALEEGHNCVVSNTFVKRWELEPYFKMAKVLGAEISLYVCRGHWLNVHGVPQHVLDRMAQNFEEWESSHDNI